MSISPIQVTRGSWKLRHTGEVIPQIHISIGKYRVQIAHDKARYVVDAVHDLCDEIEAEQREAVTHAPVAHTSPSSKTQEAQ